MADANATLSDNDEDFVSCQICLINFDDKKRVPKFMKGCHHYFCLLCIKSLVEKNQPISKIECPVCREVSVLAKINCEDLATNQVALHLLNVVLGKAEAKKELEKKKNWCTNCAIPANSFCYAKEHPLQSYNEIFTLWSNQLISQKKEIQLICDQALEDHKAIKSIHHVILAWVKWLQLEINSRETSNAVVRMQIESLKESEDFGMINEDISATMRRFEQLLAQLATKHKEAIAVQSKARNLLQTYGGVQPERSSNETPAAAQNLPDWQKIFRTFNCDAIGSSNNIFASFLLEGKHEEKDINEPLPSCSGLQQTSKRLSMQDSLGTDSPPIKRGRGRGRGRPRTNTSISTRKPSVNSSDVGCLNTSSSLPIPSSSSLVHCFFDLQVENEKLERVIVQVENALAPVMSSKFLEYCIGDIHPGYLSTPVFVTPLGPQEIPSLRGGQIIDLENQLFIADVSPLPAKLGSVLFIVKEANHWGTVVSPEFQILLGEPSKDQTKIQTTVFGQVVAGLPTLHKLNNNNQQPAQIIACGMTKFP